MCSGGVECGRVTFSPPCPPPLPTQVCGSLGVELEVVPLTTQYWERVVQHSVAEIRAGRTPNPDMLCNSRVKVRARRELSSVGGGGGWAGGVVGWWDPRIAGEGVPWPRVHCRPRLLSCACLSCCE